MFSPYLNSERALACVALGFGAPPRRMRGRGVFCRGTCCLVAHLISHLVGGTRKRKDMSRPLRERVNGYKSNRATHTPSPCPPPQRAACRQQSRAGRRMRRRRVCATRSVSSARRAEAEGVGPRRSRRGRQRQPFVRRSAPRRQLRDGHSERLWAVPPSLHHINIREEV